jgi:hypothetical protein
MSDYTDDFDGTTRVNWRDPRALAELLGDVDSEIRAIERDVRRHADEMAGIATDDDERDT